MKLSCLFALHPCRQLKRVWGSWAPGNSDDHDDDGRARPGGSSSLSLSPSSHHHFPKTLKTKQKKSARRVQGVIDSV